MANSNLKNNFKLSLPFFYVIPFLLFIPTILIAQQDLPESVERYNIQEDAMRLNVLREIYSTHKIIPSVVEQQVLVALAHYPELIDVPIEFIVKKAKVAHTSSIVIRSIFRRKHLRRYRITISTDVNEVLSPGLHSRLSYNAKIGVIGHELGHTLYYKDKSGWQIFCFGVKYLFKK